MNPPPTMASHNTGIDLELDEAALTSPDLLSHLNASDALNSTHLETQTDLDSWVNWREAQKLNCYSLLIEETNVPPYNGKFCPRVWDQLLCWPPTLAGTVASLPCSAVPEFNRQGYSGDATRICNLDGAWEGNSTNLVPGWTNYSACISHPLPEFPHLIFDWLPLIKSLSIIGYSISLATLLISFSILASLKRLRCPRNILHLHLFVSFILRASVVLVKSQMDMEEDLPPNLLHLQVDSHSNTGTWGCQLLITIWQYFILANYSWILMEGLYLHNLIFLALFSDSSAITMYIILGWGLPLVCVSTWAILRVSLDNVHCWTVKSVQWIFWLCIRIPVALSNLLNFFFFLNVTRVLLLKMRSSISPESMRYRKLGKSTLVLVPLFGVHYFLLWGLSVSTNASVELAWLLLDTVFASFQGFFVAVLYCLMNGEVRQELRKFVNRFRGDGLPELSYSTAMSNTRSYFSRGRTSIHSIHSTIDRKGDGKTPSPQMSRMADCLSPTPKILTPTSGKLPEYYFAVSPSQKSHDTLNVRSSSENVNESIELQNKSPQNVSLPIEWEEAVPLISNNHKAEVHPSKPCSEDGQKLFKTVPSSVTNESSSSPEVQTGVKTPNGRNIMEPNGMVGFAKEILVKVNVHDIGGSAESSLIVDETKQNESML